MQKNFFHETEPNKDVQKPFCNNEIEVGLKLVLHERNDTQKS